MTSSDWDFRIALLILGSFSFLAPLGCSGGSPGNEGSASAADGVGQDPTGDRIEAPEEVWSLGAEPSLAMGVVEGEEAYQFHQARSSVRLDDGRIVVANTGSQEIRFFDSQGRYLRSVGGDGDGPGEFRFPDRVRTVGKDSLLVWDQRPQRVSYLDLDGEFLGSERLMPTQEVLFPGDEWLFGRFWIDSPIPPAAREPIRNAARGIAIPDSLESLFFLKVTQQGRIWASTVRPPADTAISWVVYDLDGWALAGITTPPRFEPHDIGPDYVMGRALDEMDINYIRLYQLRKPEGSPDGPGLDSTPPPVDPTRRLVRSAAEEEELAGVKDLLKMVATLQEIHYSTEYTYTTDLEALFSDPRTRAPDDLSLTLLFATGEGWMGTVTHVESGNYCALAYGAYVPMGWSPGMIICP